MIPPSANRREVALLRAQIDQAFQTIHRGLRGLTDENERHDFVYTHISTTEPYYKQLLSLVGTAEAVALLIDAWLHAEEVVQREG